MRAFMTEWGRKKFGRKGEKVLWENWRKTVSDVIPEAVLLLLLLLLLLLRHKFCIQHLFSYIV